MLPALIATQLTDRGARARRLNIGGLDVLKPYGSTWTTQYHVPIESIALTEEGAGAVSSLTFDIEDPRIELPLAEGSDVEFWDITNDRPLFAGFLQAFTPRPDGVNRTIGIRSVGIEVLLDWMLVPALTIPAGTDQVAAIQSIVANATGVGWPVRAFAFWSIGTGYSAVSSQAFPIAVGTDYTLDYDLVLDGDSVRGAIAKVFTSSVSASGPPKGSLATNGGLVTIDYYGGLRVIPTYLSGGLTAVYLPADYDDLDISNTSSGARAVAGLDMTIDASGIVRAVYVKGGNAAGSGLVSDGSGIPGPVSTISDATSLDGTKRNNIAGDYLLEFSQSPRGQAPLFMSPADLASNYRPGGTVTFAADGQTFNDETTFVIASIRKTFLGNGNQNWTVSFGGHKPSAMKQLRRLTRDVRS